MLSLAPADCFSNRLARVGRAVDRGEWANGHALIDTLRKCRVRHACSDGEACADAAELLMAEVRTHTGEQRVAMPPQP